MFYVLTAIIFALTLHRFGKGSKDSCVQNCNLWCNLCESGRIAPCDNHNIVCNQIKCKMSCKNKLISVKPGKSSRRFCNELCDTEHIICEAEANGIKDSLDCLARKSHCTKSCKRLANGKRSLKFF